MRRKNNNFLTGVIVPLFLLVILIASQSAIANAQSAHIDEKQVNDKALLLNMYHQSRFNNYDRDFAHGPANQESVFYYIKTINPLYQNNSPFTGFKKGNDRGAVTDGQWVHPSRKSVDKKSSNADDEENEQAF